jgi:hypothetical protein
MQIELIIKGTTNNNIKTIQFPISKEQLYKELEQLGGNYIIIGINIDGRKVF